MKSLVFPNIKKKTKYTFINVSRHNSGGITTTFDLSYTAVNSPGWVNFGCICLCHCLPRQSEGMELSELHITYNSSF